MAARNQRVVIVVVILFSGFVGYLLSAATYRSRYAPRDGASTFAALKKQGIPLIRAVRVASPAGHVCVFGDATADLWTLPSGPPAYLFDDSGRLVDFTLDVGDNSRFQSDYGVYQGAEIDIETLEQSFKK